MQEVLAAIDAKNNALIHAFKQRDAAQVAAIYADDATLMPPHNDVLRGREAIERFFRKGIGMGVHDFRIETTEVDAREDLAYEVGRFQRRISTVRGDELTDTCKYVMLWRRHAEGWRPQSDIWNSAGPVEREAIAAPAQAAPAEVAAAPAYEEVEPVETIEPVEEAVEAVEAVEETGYEEPAQDHHHEETQIVSEDDLQPVE